MTPMSIYMNSRPEKGFIYRLLCYCSCTATLLAGNLRFPSVAFPIEACCSSFLPCFINDTMNIYIYIWCHALVIFSFFPFLEMDYDVSLRIVSWSYFHNVLVPIYWLLGDSNSDCKMEANLLACWSKFIEQVGKLRTSFIFLLWSITIITIFVVAMKLFIRLLCHDRVPTMRFLNVLWMVLYHWCKTPLNISTLFVLNSIFWTIVQCCWPYYELTS